MTILRVLKIEGGKWLSKLRKVTKTLIFIEIVAGKVRKTMKILWS